MKILNANIYLYRNLYAMIIPMTIISNKNRVLWINHDAPIINFVKLGNDSWLGNMLTMVGMT